MSKNGGRKWAEWIYKKMAQFIIRICEKIWII